jgi:hypothetical protein
MGVSGHRHAPSTLFPGERTPGTHCTGGWVGPRAGLDTEARGRILYPCCGSNPDRPAVQSVARHYTAWATRLTSPLKASQTLRIDSCYCVNVVTICKHIMLAAPGIERHKFNSRLVHNHIFREACQSYCQVTFMVSLTSGISNCWPARDVVYLNLNLNLFTFHKS